MRKVYHENADGGDLVLVSFFSLQEKKKCRLSDSP